MAQEIDPKQFLTKAASEAAEGLDLILGLDENHVDIKQVEQIQRKLSTAASEVTKLKTWMLENLPPVKEE